MNADDLVSGGESKIQHLVDSHAQEGLHLDFKGGRIFTDGQLARSGKEALADALSSFANSDGGIIIFGVDCRKNGLADEAVSLTPVQNLPAALTSLTDLVGEALQPKHDGITVKAMPLSADPTSGFLVVDIPRSSRRPHMNSYRKAYFKRAGASKFAMEHYDVEDAFRRQTGPDLDLQSKLQRHPDGDVAPGECRFQWLIACTNHGVGSARHIVIQYPTRNGLGDSSIHQRQPDCTQSIFGSTTTLAFPADMVLHPGDTRVLRKFYFSWNPRGGVPSGPWDSARRELVFAVDVMAEDMRRKSVTLKLGYDDISERL